jgi:hypothetical protein
MSTVGYGDIAAVTGLEKLVAIIGMVLGASVFAYMMGAMSNALANMNATQVRCDPHPLHPCQP